MNSILVVRLVLHTFKRQGLGALLVAAMFPLGLAAQVRVIDAGYHHLGDTKLDGWKRATAEPEGLSLTVKFRAKRNRDQQCLLIDYRDVDNRWPILVNGTSIGDLKKSKVFGERLHVLPPGILKDGANEIFLKCNRKTDDILVGNFRIVPKTLREHLRLRRVRVAVMDAGNQPLPAKVTVTDKTGERLETLYFPRGEHLAVRAGVAYTSNGKVEFELPVGEYVCYASRGMEWSVAEVPLVVSAGGLGDRVTCAARLRREVDTTGYVASDTHIHTVTISGHGDSTLEERMVTLAGEGVELAIATDHNHQVDYRPFQEKVKLTGAFKSVVGNEVTTSNGHFNAFPFPPEGANKRRNKKLLPNHKLKDWVKLVADIRAKGAQVIILNHPRWPAVQTGPFGKKHFELNRISGARKRGPAFRFDAMELVNACVKAPNPLYNFIDWFALLNHGEKITAVGSSDSHTVGDPVGQGRTYLRSRTDDPAKIDVDEACRAFVKGYSSISQGLFTEVWLGDQHRMGATATLQEKRFRITLRIACATWCHPDRARVYINGRLVADRKLKADRSAPKDMRVGFALETPPNDAHVVCIATGPGVRGRFWRGPSTNPYVLGATNPIYLDVDGDGRYTSPRHQALAILKKDHAHDDRLVASLKEVDDAVAVQLLAELQPRRAKQLIRRLPGRMVLATFAASLGGK